MSAHTINLRSENPALLVEFILLPGTHARIGAALNAEVSIPLAGLAEIAVRIGCDPGGRLYVADPDGENPRFIDLPADLPLPPYQFVILHPAAQVEMIPAPTTRLKPAPVEKPPSRKILPVAAIAAAVLALASLIVFDRTKQPFAVSPKPLAAALPKTPQPPVLAVEKLPPKPPEPLAESKPVKESAPTPVTKIDLEQLAQRIAPAVFRLEVKDAGGQYVGIGTAFAISAEGLAVTNFHVVENGESFTARTTQGAEFAVSGVTATDPKADLALIALKASNLPFLELGESETLKIGVPVAVFGCPQGLSGSLSEGILSARRTEPEIAGSAAANGGRLLQITAPISGGSSGSPVIDQTGKVIGVAAAVLTGPTSQNLNFVIPVEAVLKLRKDSMAGIAPRIFVKKEAAPPDEEKNPDSLYFADPSIDSLRRYTKADDGIEALKVARALVARHPNSPAAHGGHAIALFLLGLHEQAETAAKRALAIDPEHDGIWSLLGETQKAQGNHKDARESWKHALGLDPENARTWHLLAASYIRDGRYMEALDPLTNLRKLDRGAFEKILSVLRSLPSHPPQLQTVLIHFKSMADDEIQKDQNAPDPAKLAASLVAGFLQHGQEQDARAELADYSATVEPYFDNGRKTKAQISKDIADYRAKWPVRRYELIGIESARRDDIDILEATYRFRLIVSNGKATRRSTLIQGIRYERIGGKWLVAGVQTIDQVKE